MPSSTSIAVPGPTVGLLPAPLLGSATIRATVMTMLATGSRNSTNPTTMSTSAPHTGVGGVYRTPHAVHTRSLAKATHVSGLTVRKLPPPHEGHTLLTG